MIGILDSGVGGLSVLREVRALLPDEELIYAGDSAFCPYGNKPKEVLCERIGGVVEFLLEQGARTIVLACNSATVQAVEWCRERWPDVPFVGMAPGVKPAVAATKSKVIGVLATEASLTGELFRKLVAEHCEGCVVLTRACPRFVELVEAGRLDGAEAESAVREYAGPMIAEGADVLVLGCTHYPFLKEEIARIFPKVTLIDTGAAVARRVVKVHTNPSRMDCNRIRFCTSGDPQVMRDLLPQLLPGIHGSIEQLALCTGEANDS